MNIRSLPLLLLAAMAISLTSCSCSSGSGKADKPDLPTTGGIDNPNWAETALTATSLPPAQINPATASQCWMFANTIRANEAWILNSDELSSNEAADLANDMEIREDGWPAILPEGCYMRLSNAGYPTSADSSTWLHGVWVLTWEGTGNVELQTSENNGDGETTLLSEEGRVIKLITTPLKYPIVFVHSSDPGDPVHNVCLWAPEHDGAGMHLTASSPLEPGQVEGSLEPAPGETAPLFHPVYLAHIKEPGAGIPLRMMDFLRINLAEDEWPDRKLNWEDRGDASYSFSSLSVTDSSWTRHNVTGYRQTLGMPYEWLIELCNETDNDLWIQVPHTCSEDLIRGLARLIAGKESHKGLKSTLRVWFEYSNEIWNGAGVYLPQYNFAGSVASEEFGVSESELTTAQRGWAAGYLQGWALAVFEDEWAKCGQTDERLINVVSGFAMSDAYNLAQIQAVKEINPCLPETLAISNYFGHSATSEIYALHDWAASDGISWPESLISQSKAALQRNLYDTYASWQANARMASSEGVHLVSYEGGQHLTPVGLGHSDDTDFQKFMGFLSMLQTHRVMYDLYTEHYALWTTAGGRTVSLFVDIGPHSYWGYWGAKKLVTETAADSAKWKSFIDWLDTMRGVRALNDAEGTSPSLPDVTFRAEAGIPFSAQITPEGGDGAVTVELMCGELPEGISFISGQGSASITGTPTSSSFSRFVVRALDADGDPDYMVFSLTVDPAGMSANAIVRFNGEDIPSTVQTDGSTNGRYDPSRNSEYIGEYGETLCVPFTVEEGTWLFGDEYSDSSTAGGGFISPESSCNMYGGWSVTQTSGPSIELCQTSYTTLRENRFLSWSGANCDGTGAPTELNVFLAWKKLQFNSFTGSEVYAFGDSPETSTLRIDFTDLISDGSNEIRFAVLNRENGSDVWYVSEASYDKSYIGDGYLEVSSFDGSSKEGKRWAPISPEPYSFGIPDPNELAFAPKSFNDIQAVGIMYRGSRAGYHYSFGFNRFAALAAVK